MYTVYTKKGCKWCVEVRKLLPEAAYVEPELTDAFFAEMDPLTKGYRMFPMVFEDGEFVGGYKETRARLFKVEGDEF